MRTYLIRLLAVGLTLSACDDGGGPSTDVPPTDGPPTVGTLVVSTASGGNSPDKDGYLLAVDGVDSVHVEPTGTLRIDLPAGQYTLRLLGMAEQCAVSPGIPLDVAVRRQDTTSVLFEVTCSVTGVRIATTTAGLDFDVDGYRVDVDGTDRGILPSIGNVLTRLEPGTRTVALTGLAPNCTIVGPGSHTVNIVAFEIAQIDFAAACTATSGVIRVAVHASGTAVEGTYVASMDEKKSVYVRLSEPGYLTTVAAGDHVVSLVAPTNCSVETDPQSVTVTAGGLIRDTVDVAFSVACVPRGPATLRITAPTTGAIPAGRYSVEICRVRYDCIFYGTWKLLGNLEPNGTLVALLVPSRYEVPGRYQLLLKDVPARCRVRPSILSPVFTVTDNATIEIEFRVTCRP